MYKLYSTLPTINLQTGTNHHVVQPAEAEIMENVISHPLMSWMQGDFSKFQRERLVVYLSLEKRTWYCSSCVETVSITVHLKMIVTCIKWNILNNLCATVVLLPTI